MGKSTSESRLHSLGSLNCSDYFPSERAKSGNQLDVTVAFGWDGEAVAGC
jgi:hypothetical protein